MANAIRVENLDGKYFTARTLSGAIAFMVNFYCPYKESNGVKLVTIMDYSSEKIFHGEWGSELKNKGPYDYLEESVRISTYVAEGWSFVFKKKDQSIFDISSILKKFRGEDYEGYIYYVDPIMDHFDNGKKVSFCTLRESSVQEREQLERADKKFMEEHESRVAAERAGREAMEAAEREERERVEAEERRKQEAIAAAERAKRDARERAEAEERRKVEEAERIEREAREREAAFWASPEGQKVRAAQMMADIERQRALDAAKIRIAEQERIAEIGRQIRDEERQSQADLIRQVKDL